MEEMSADGPCGPPLNPELVYGSGPKVLKTIYERRQAGASLADIRRATAVDDSVTDAHLESAAEGGRWVSEYLAHGQVRPRRRVFGGIDLPGPQRDEA